MARIRLLSPGQPVADFSVASALITVHSLAVDCAEQYAQNVRTVEVRGDGAGNAVVGGTGPFLAVIGIPGQRFEQGDNGPVLLPLDPNAITITLWPSA